MAGIKVIAQPAVEPVILGDIKAQLGIDDSDSMYDERIVPLIPAAREWCEKHQNRAYITQTLEIALDCWPMCNKINLLRPPLQSVSVVTYGADDVVWPSSEYLVDTYAFVGALVRNKGTGWPSTSLPSVNGIRITYIAGYGEDATSVPVTIKQAIIMLVVHWFNNGLCDPPNAVYALLNLERVIPV